MADPLPEPASEPSPGRGYRLFAGLLLAAVVVAGGVWLVRAMVAASPGPLSAHTGDGQTRGGVESHAELEARCEACHPGGDASKSVSALCLDCHDEIELQRRDPRALHSRLGNTDDCLACHTEHKGRDAEITHVEPAAFPHDAVGFALTAHQKTAAGAPFQCEDCHAQSMTRFDAGQCTTCHLKDKPDLMRAHVAAFGERCAACHDGVDRFSTGRFDHRSTGFALEGKHAATGCELCHAGVRDMAGFGEAKSACVDCHADAGSRAHAGKLGDDCAACHGVAAWKPATFDHASTDFPLTGKHTTVPCAQCHHDDLKAPLPTGCADCHKAPASHAAEGYGADCTECHDTQDWGAVGAKNHTFPLNHGVERGGKNTACKTCHPASYKQYTCFNCHEHEPGAMLRLHRHETRARTMEQIRDCVRCHKTGEGEEGEEGEDDDHDERSDE